MKFTTPVEIPTHDINICPTSKLTFIGSCFAQNIGLRASHAGIDTHVNPFGVLYNPLSIAVAIDAMLKQHTLPENIFLLSDGIWHCYLFDSTFSADTLDACRHDITQTLEREARHIPFSDYLFLTFGTNRYYILKETRRPVGNCHKQPAALFEEKQLSIDETVETLESTLQSLWAINANLKVVCTISPYRYAKYGFHQSQIGKAVLLMAVEQLCCAYPSRCFYFPAYEILLDELRDYRFYAPDMLHPSETAVDYIWQLFADSCFSQEAKHLAAQWNEIERAANHRPLHPQSKAQQTFLNLTTNKLRLLIKQYPHLASTSAYKQLQAKLSLKTQPNAHPKQ